MSCKLSFAIPLDRLERLHQMFHDRQGLPDRRWFLKYRRFADRHNDAR